MESLLCPELSQVYQELSILYNVENLDLNTETSIADRFKAVAIIAPKDSFPNEQLTKLDDYLARGGNIFIAYNAVEGDLQQSRGSAVSTNLETWLKDKGLQVESSFIVDASCGSVSVQQRQGFFSFNTPIQFPFLPLISNFPEHPITKGMEQVILPFASPVNYVGDGSTQFTPLLQTSDKSGSITAPTFFNIQKKWAAPDFPLSNQTIGGILEGNLSGDVPAKIVIIGDGDFPVTGQQGRGQSKDNISLMVNSIDWLSDDTGLIELRTKGVATRPIDELEDATRSTIKWGNFLIPILVVIAFGFIRMQRQRSQE